MKQAFDSLARTNARTRLASYRAKADSWCATFNGDCHYCKQFASGLNGGTCHYCKEAVKTDAWKGQRYDAPTKRHPGIGRIADKPGFLWADSLEATGWRMVGFADEIISLRYTAWFADNFQDETIRGAVLQLPARNGVAQYVPAIVWSGSDGITIDVRYIADESKDAARWADDWAERAAEESREAYAKDQAEFDISNAREQIHEINKAALLLIREIKEAKSTGFTPAICAALRDRLESYLDERREQFKIIEAREDNYWTAVGGY